jgi:hypothetical protein
MDEGSPMSEKRIEGSSEVLHSLMAEAARRKKDRDEGRRELGIEKPKRPRGVYDMPEHLKLVIAVLADREGLSHSGTVALLLSEGVRQYATGEISFEGTKTPIEHKAHDYIVDEETIMKILHGEPLKTSEVDPGILTK